MLLPKGRGADFPPTEGEGCIFFFFWCGSRWRRRQLRRLRDSFLSARYLMNWLADFNQICMAITLGHDEEPIRFWCP